MCNHNKKTKVKSIGWSWFFVAFYKWKVKKSIWLSHFFRAHTFFLPVGDGALDVPFLRKPSPWGRGTIYGGWGKKNIIKGADCFRIPLLFLPVGDGASTSRFSTSFAKGNIILNFVQTLLPRRPVFIFTFSVRTFHAPMAHFKFCRCKTFHACKARISCSLCEPLYASLFEIFPSLQYTVKLPVEFFQ